MLVGGGVVGREEREEEGQGEGGDVAEAEVEGDEQNLIVNRRYGYRGTDGTVTR